MSDIKKFNEAIQEWRAKPAATGSGEPTKFCPVACKCGELVNPSDMRFGRCPRCGEPLPTPPSSPPAAVTQQAIAILEELHAMAPCGPGPSVPFAVGDECAYDNTCKVHRRIAIAIRLLRAAEAQGKQD